MRSSRLANRPPARCRPRNRATSSSRFRPSNSPILRPSWRRSRAPKAWMAPARSRARSRLSSSSRTSSTTALAISPAPRRCSTDAWASARHPRDRPGGRASPLSPRRFVATTAHFDRREAKPRVDHRSVAVVCRSARRRTRPLPVDRDRGAERRRLCGGLGREPAPLLHLPPRRQRRADAAATAGGPKS